MRIVGFTGVAGSGKDTAAQALVGRGWVRIGLADPLKRACQEWFGWPDALLWGASELRSHPDAARGGLTPRHALQHLGTGFGRACWADTWVDLLLRDAERVTSGGWSYSPESGAVSARASGRFAPPASGVVVTDVRFANEVDAIRRAGGRVLRVERRGAGLVGAAASHASEREIARLVVDGVLYNDRSIEELHESVLRLTSDL